MVETVCENNDDCIDSDYDTIEIIVEKSMVVPVLADDPNYEYYLQKQVQNLLTRYFLIVGVAPLIVVQKL